MRLRKLLLSLITIGTFALYAVVSGKKEVAIVVPPPTPSPSFPDPTPTLPSPLPSPHPSPTPLPNPSPSPVPPTPLPPPTPPPPLGKFKNGTFTGNSADAFYGYIKVQAVIENGKLADVIFLDYPNDRSNSVRINKYAMPILRSEAIKIQDSKVDIVSGATDSSLAFRKSLANALAQAKI
jgi:uncharacterized protein with FMN-binding domain